MVKYLGDGGFILGQTAWEEGLPWLRPMATEYIKCLLPQGASIFEWGMGASTIWFARQKHSVASFELDPEWYKQVGERVVKENLMPFVQPYYFGIIKGLNSPNIQMYADAILSATFGKFDLILVDGRNRCRCLANARSKVKVGGMLCLDNSERPEYAKAIALLDIWDGVSWGDEGWMTTVWVRPEGEVEPITFPNEDA